MREEFLRNVWLQVYLKAMEIQKRYPEAVANEALKEAKVQFPDDNDYFDQELKELLDEEVTNT